MSDHRREVGPQSESRSEYRLCILCRAGHFQTEPPLSGECRRNPPRSFLDDGRPGRFFPFVRFDDWCGQHSAIGDKAKISARLAAVGPYRSPAIRLQMANRLYEDGDHSAARPIYESIYSGNSDEAEIAHRIGRSYLAACRKKGEPSACKAALKWLTEAADRSHPAAPMSLGFLYAHGLGVEKDVVKANELLEESANRRHPAAIDKLKEGGFRAASLSSDEGSPGD